MNGTPECLLLDAEMMELVLPVVRADFGVCDSYKFDPEPFLTCPIFAFGALDDPDIKRARAKFFSQLCLILDLW